MVSFFRFRKTTRMSPVCSAFSLSLWNGVLAQALDPGLVRNYLPLFLEFSPHALLDSLLARRRLLTLAHMRPT